MFEDIARNLEAPHSLGMTTVLVTSPENQDTARLNAMDGGGHVDHVTHDLAAFLIDITTALAQNR